MEIKAGEVLFIDTNVLLTATDESRSHFDTVRRLFVAAFRTGFHLGLNGQIMREYLVVSTRAQEINGLGLSSEEAIENIEEFRRRVTLFEEREAVTGHLVQLARRHGLSGKRIHDANIVATMLTYKITKLVTENTNDFTDFSEIQVLDLNKVSRMMEDC